MRGGGRGETKKTLLYSARYFRLTPRHRDFAYLTKMIFFIFIRVVLAKLHFEYINNRPVYVLIISNSNATVIIIIIIVTVALTVETWSVNTPSPVHTKTNGLLFFTIYTVNALLNISNDL